MKWAGPTHSAAHNSGQWGQQPCGPQTASLPALPGIPAFQGCHRNPGHSREPCSHLARFRGKNASPVGGDTGSGLPPTPILAPFEAHSQETLLHLLLVGGWGEAGVGGSRGGWPHGPVFSLGRPRPLPALLTTSSPQENLKQPLL